MSDNMRYTPSNIQVKQGETVRFVVKNVGQVKHELSLGTEKELLEHLEQMKKFPDMEHDEPGKVTLQPGKQGEIVWQFTKAGRRELCLPDAWPLRGRHEGHCPGWQEVIRHRRAWNKKSASCSRKSPERWDWQCPPCRWAYGRMAGLSIGAPFKRC
jgi:hypothetical protein